jgi:hypothetical protein
MQIPPPAQQPAEMQKKPAGHSAVLVQCWLVSQSDPVVSRQRFTPSAVPKQKQSEFVVLQGVEPTVQLSALHVFATTTQEPPLHASPALQQTPLQH